MSEAMVLVLSGVIGIISSLVASGLFLLAISKVRPKIAGTDSHDFPIFADKWYLLHPQEEAEEHPREEGEEGDSYTGTFESREEALADPRSENSEPLRSKELVSRLAEREKKRAEKRAEKRANN